MKMLKNAKMMKDIVINIMAMMLLAIVIQLLIFPFLSREIGIEQFGIAITLYGFNQLITTFVGNTINNIRLVYDDKIKEKGNFSIIIFLALIIASLVSIFLYIIYSPKSTVLELSILVGWTILSSLRAYLVVYFRLKLNFINILIDNAVTIFGFFIGVIIFSLYNIWTIVFFAGELFSVIYLLLKTPFLNEKPKKDEEFHFLVKETSNLTISNFLLNAMKYLDRFLITPILGANSMSLYYTVSIFSKLINMVITPFNNVILSYLNRLEMKNFSKIFLVYNLYTIVLLIPIYFIMYYSTPLLMQVFYPQYLNVSNVFVGLVSLSNILNLLTSIINPFILKFKSMKYQTLIQFYFALIYIISAIILISTYGLFGFVLSTCISYFIKWIIMLYIGVKK